MQSRFDAIAQTIMIPSLLQQFGVDAIHTNADADEVAVTVILSHDVEQVGDYGERAETRWTIDIPSSSGAAVGDTFSIASEPTADDLSPDPITWVARQLLDDDGVWMRFAVIQQ